MAMHSMRCVVSIAHKGNFTIGGGKMNVEDLKKYLTMLSIDELINLCSFFMMRASVNSPEVLEVLEKLLEEKKRR